MPPPLPESYSTLPFQHIRVSHIPPESPTPTPVILITLHRPLNKNAFTDLMTGELVQTFNTLSLDPRVKSIVLTGHGSIFCAGADLSPSTGGGLTYPSDTLETHRDGGGQVVLAIHNCTKPVVAAINGHAVGVGITMTLPCAVRIVSSKAKIGFVFGKRGIVMEAASSFFLPRLVGWSRAMWLVSTGEVVSARDEKVGGLWGEVVDCEGEREGEGRVVKRAIEVAGKMAKEVSGVSWALMRDLIWRGKGTVEETHLLDSKILFELFEGRDKKEGVSSFLEKRDAEFKGTMEKDAPSVWPWWEKVDVSVKGGKSKL